ncbi:dihydrolipoyl dehydrogenase family protein [Thiobacter aerophilum]|uniref:Dihydrolipoyl dehydrogenase n=1 Tax=Thiobacter aerophilum TaxID=3121275 RepID=A0ABV0EI09_9BURK
MDKFDLIIIGSGPGGYKAALTAARLGAKVALIEKALPGGNCLNLGCIPKKTLLHLASIIEDVQHLNGRGLVGEIRGDFRAAMRHKDDVVAGIRNNFPVWLRRLGVAVITGRARFIGPYEIAVDPTSEHEQEPVRTLSAPRIIIATGSEPKPLAQCPTDGHFILNTRDFMSMTEDQPRSMLFVGGGMANVELAYLMHQFGTDVLIVEREPSLLPNARIPEHAINTLVRKFNRIGLEFRTETSVAACHVEEAGVAVSFDDGSEGRFDKILVAVGRRPLTAGLDLDKAGVKVNEEGFIITSSYLETNVPGIYAIGDVKPGPMTANAALHDAKIAATNALTGNELTFNYFMVPTVLHSAMEIAAVGLTEEQAEAAGFEPEAARTSFGGSGKARAYHDTEGFIEVVHDAETGQLLGGCIVGPEAGEQIQMMTAACQSEQGLWFFKELSYSHPSWAEEFETAIEPCTSAFSRSAKEVFRPGIFRPLRTKKAVRNS